MASQTDHFTSLPAARQLRRMRAFYTAGVVLWAASSIWTGPRIFLDANVVIRCGKPPGSPVMPRIADLVAGGFIRVVTTDLTKAEIAKKHTNNDLEEIGVIAKRRFREIARRSLGINIPELSPDQLREKLHQKYTAEVQAMFATLRAKTISIDCVAPSKVFETYSRKEGMFTGEGKKDQFPDAFILEALKTTATAEDPLIIVSDDKDFGVAIRGEPHINGLNSISALFDHLGFTIEAAQRVEAFFDKNALLLVQVVDREVNSWGLQVSDIEDAEIDDSEVTSVCIDHFVTYAAPGKDDPILVVGRLEAQVNVTYNHPDWDTATYDSEDKVLLPHHHISGEKEVTIEADFTMLIKVDNNGNPNSIAEFSFDDESFIWVRLAPSDHDYK